MTVIVRDARKAAQPKRSLPHERLVEMAAVRNHPVRKARLAYNAYEKCMQEEFRA